jgi:GT2 family glycosyltransferase
MTGFPEISVVIVNYNGKQHLQKCIASLRKLNYPREKIEIIIVDNGSKDGSVELLRDNYSFVKLITNTRNEGFAKPSNDGARAARGEYVAFLNNDMRVDVNWLRELVASLGNNDAQCAGSVILSWDGKQIDFVGGSVNFYGLGYQENFKKPLNQMKTELENDRQILFACGGAMLVNKKIFLDAGGFDEDYFAYYEDVDLGWRLHILGCKIVLSVKSRVCHKHNSTSKLIARERVQYLFERNKLYTIYKNYGELLFNKVFFSTLLLDIREVFLHSGIDGNNYKIENTSEYYDDPVRVDHYSALKLAALNDFVTNISKMEAKRRFIQANRKSPDAEIMRFVEKPFMVFPKDTPEFINTEFDIIKTFEIDKALGTDYKSKVLVVANDDLTANADIRCLAIAKALGASGLFAVTLACTGCKEKLDGIELLVYSQKEITQLIQTTIETNIVFLTPEAIEKTPALEEYVCKKFVVIDVAIQTVKDVSCDMATEGSINLLEKFLKLGDFFICVSQEQKLSLAASLENLARNGQTSGDAVSLKTAQIEVIPFVNDEELGAFMAPMIKYCVNPVHSGLRDDQGAINLLNLYPDEAEGDTKPMQGRGSVLERLYRIEAGQEKIKNMLRDDIRITKQTDEEVLEVKKWTALMDSRFAKLKSRLGKIKLLSRFIN